MIKLEHANLSVADVEATTRFLITAFPEFRLRGEGHDSQGRPWRHVGTNDFYVALQAVPQRSGREPYGNATGLNHLGWEVEDVDALEARMRAAGYRPNLRDDTHPARKRTYFLDADGYDWEFVEYLSDDPAERHDYA